MKKALVLFILFILPIVAYLFFASGVTHFGKLPVLTKQINGMGILDSSATLKGKITILGFLGSQVDEKKGNAFNLNQKIYKRFHEFEDFQIVIVLPNGKEEEVESLKKELGYLSNVDKWEFVFMKDTGVSDFFGSLGTDLELDGNLATPYVFIIDKDENLRGRTDDEDQGTKYGFNTASVADLHNKMVDDVKIILAEYRLALKKNNAQRKK